MNVAHAAVPSSAEPTGSNSYFSDFASSLRYWRDKRGYTQLRLSAESAISQRHISFLESARSQPSKELILKLGTILDIPLRERNTMLLAAGFAPAYHERKLSDPELATVMQALNFMLTQHEPYPALVVDRLWNLKMTNGPATMLMKWLLDMPEHQDIPSTGINLLKLMLDPMGIRKYVTNWESICDELLHWVQKEAMNDGPGSEATSLLKELILFPGVHAAMQTSNLDPQTLPFLVKTIKKGNVELNMFTSITSMGASHDVTVHELRIESFFPADAMTADWFKFRLENSLTNKSK